MDPKQIRYNEHGVPEYSAQDLENKAEEVLSFFDEAKLETPAPTPFGEITRRLNKDYNIEIDLAADLGFISARNERILGRFVFNPRAILIDSSLQQDTGPFNFTLAHEIGHLVLHRKLKLKGDFDPDEISDTKRDLVTGKKILTTPHDWIEWQANRFASSLLMPRPTVRKAVIQKQKEMGIRSNIGFIYLENKPYSVADYVTQVQHLELVYGASKTAIECRLSDLGILIDKRLQDTKHISELFRAE